MTKKRCLSQMITGVIGIALIAVGMGFLAESISSVRRKAMPQIFTLFAYQDDGHWAYQWGGPGMESFEVFRATHPTAIEINRWRLLAAPEPWPNENDK